MLKICWDPEKSWCGYLYQQVWLDERHIENKRRLNDGDSGLGSGVVSSSHGQLVADLGKPVWS